MASLKTSETCQKALFRTRLHRSQHTRVFVSIFFPFFSSFSFFPLASMPGTRSRSFRRYFLLLVIRRFIRLTISKAVNYWQDDQQQGEQKKTAEKVSGFSPNFDERSINFLFFHLLLHFSRKCNYCSRCYRNWIFSRCLVQRVSENSAHKLYHSPRTVASTFVIKLFEFLSNSLKTLYNIFLISPYNSGDVKMFLCIFSK